MKKIKIKMMEIDMNAFSHRSGIMFVKEYHETRNGLKKNPHWEFYEGITAPKKMTEKEVEVPDDWKE